MKITSEDDFIELLRDANVISDLHVAVFSLTTLIQTRNSVGLNKTFIDCQFDGIRLNGVAMGDWTFRDCTFNGLAVSSGRSSSKIELENCQIERLEITGNPYFLEALEIRGDKSSVKELIVEGGVKTMHISDGFVGSAMINGLSTDGVRIHFDQSKVDILILSGSIQLFASSSSIFRKAELANLEVRDLITTSEGEIEEWHFFNVTLAQIIILGGSFNRIKFDTVIARELLMSPAKCGEIDLINKCSFEFRNLSKEDQSNLAFKVNVLKFDRFKCDVATSIVFTNAIFEKFILNDTDNGGLIKLRNCVVNEEFSLLSSEVKKLRLNKVTLEKKCEVNIVDSDISDVRFDNFKWNNRYKLKEQYDKLKHGEQKYFHVTLRESYRQLKSLFNKNGNRIEALEFQKHELRIHFLVVQEETFKRGVSGFIDNIGNYLILGTHKWASSFGLNIWKPFFGLFIAHFILFSIFLLNNDLGYHLSFDPECDASLQASKDYFFTLLPTHGFTMKNVFCTGLECKEVNISGWSDILLRVFSGYFIYYFISASRKYHGSGGASQQ